MSLKPGFPGNGWTFSCARKWWINSLFHLACVCDFPLPLKLSKSWVFSHFYSSNSVPHSTGGEWVSICVKLSCHLGLNHDTVKYRLWKIHSFGDKTVVKCLEKRLCLNQLTLVHFTFEATDLKKVCCLSPRIRKCLSLVPFMHLQLDL